MKKTLMAIAVSCAMLSGVPAAAEDMVVSYKDLNLATEQGQKALERRIDAAARKYCGYDRTATGSRLRPAGAERCYAQAKAEAQKSFAALVAENRLGG